MNTAPITIAKNPTPFFSTMVELTIQKKVRIEFLALGEQKAQINTLTLSRKEDKSICWANEFGAVSSPTIAEIEFICIATRLAPNCWILPCTPELQDTDLF